MGKLHPIVEKILNNAFGALLNYLQDIICDIDLAKNYATITSFDITELNMSVDQPAKDIYYKTEVIVSLDKAAYEADDLNVLWYDSFEDFAGEIRKCVIRGGGQMRLPGGDDGRRSDESWWTRRPWHFAYDSSTGKNFELNLAVKSIRTKPGSANVQATLSSDCTKLTISLLGFWEINY